jgi:hypothetical protein
MKTRYVTIDRERSGWIVHDVATGEAIHVSETDHSPFKTRRSAIDFVARLNMVDADFYQVSWMDPEDMDGEN